MIPSFFYLNYLSLFNWRVNFQVIKFKLSKWETIMNPKPNPSRYSKCFNSFASLELQVGLLNWSQVRTPWEINEPWKRNYAAKLVSGAPANSRLFQQCGNQRQMNFFTVGTKWAGYDFGRKDRLLFETTYKHSQKRKNTLNFIVINSINEIRTNET